MIKSNIISSELTAILFFSASLILKLFAADQFYIKYLFYNKEASRNWPFHLLFFIEGNFLQFSEG